jgi:hypothetical protein
MPKEKFCLDHPQERLIGELDFSGNPMNERVVAAASLKGFSAIGRLKKNGYYALRCLSCFEIVRARHSVVLHCQPTCKSCLAGKHRIAAAGAGLQLLRRDPDNRQHAFFLAACGHVIRREFDLVQRTARGEAGVRCETCLAEEHRATAEARGWALIGPDPEDRISYRLYRHQCCGAEQSVAMANMQSGRFGCNSCGTAWPASRSALYVMQFALKGNVSAIKLGFSRDPASRLTYQLLSGVETTGKLLRVVEMQTGAMAIRTEKALHKRIATEMPDALLPQRLFRGQIRVRSELYYPAALPLINQLLDELEPAA